LGDLDSVAYRNLLCVFDLSEFLSLEQIATMSPAELTRLGKKDPESDTIGDHRKASEVN